MNILHIANGRIVDPANKRDEVADLWIADGLIVEKPEIRDAKSSV